MDAWGDLGPAGAENPTQLYCEGSLVEVSAGCGCGEGAVGAEAEAEATDAAASPSSFRMSDVPALAQAAVAARPVFGLAGGSLNL
jgi:hypothetical protein